MTTSERRLILKLTRFQNAVDRLEDEYAADAERDAAFDGGEWSGPATWRAFQRAADDLAQRFGFENADVALRAAEHVGAVITNAPAHLYTNDAAPLPR
ncbi:MAG TPA: hypothetical protein VFN64_09605 [Burkholderiaceae bacterium]|nr:hypothetical protein [Burkholderiaceae bacterium]